MTDISIEIKNATLGKLQLEHSDGGVTFRLPIWGLVPLWDLRPLIDSAETRISALASLLWNDYGELYNAGPGAMRLQGAYADQTVKLSRGARQTLQLQCKVAGLGFTPIPGSAVDPSAREVSLILTLSGYASDQALKWFQQAMGAGTCAVTVTCPEQARIDDEGGDDVD